MSDVLKGVVKWFNNAKGFGFIEHSSGKDVFVHYSVISQEGYKSLKDGEEVEYEIKEGPKGFHATRVQRVNPPEVAAAGDSSSKGDESDEENTSEGEANAEASAAPQKGSLASNIERISV